MSSGFGPVGTVKTCPDEDGNVFEIFVGARWSSSENGTELQVADGPMVYLDEETATKLAAMIGREALSEARDRADEALGYCQAGQLDPQLYDMLRNLVLLLEGKRHEMTPDGNPGLVTVADLF